MIYYTILESYHFFNVLGEIELAEKKVEEEENVEKMEEEKEVE